MASPNTLRFLKHTSHTFIKSKIFDHLETNEIALRLEMTPKSAPSKGKKSFSYKKLQESALIEESKNGTLPIEEIAMYEIISVKKDACKFFLKLQDWDIQKLSLKRCIEFLKWTFLQFWKQHTLFSQFELTDSDLSFVIGSFPEYQTELQLIATKYAFPTKNLKYIVAQFRTFLRSQSSRQEDDFAYFLEQMIKIKGGIIDTSVYYKNASVRLVGSYDLTQNHQGEFIIDKWTQLYEHPNHRCISSKLLITSVHALVLIPYHDVLQYEEYEEWANWKSSEMSAHLERALFPIQVKLKELNYEEKDWHITRLTCKHDSLYLTLATQKCPFQKRIHRHAHLKVQLHAWAVSLQCWSIHCKQQQWWYHLPSELFTNLFHQRNNPILTDDLHIDRFFQTYGIPPSWEIIRYESAIVHDYFQDSYKWHMEQSAMCTQKTMQAIRLVERWKPLRYSYLIVCPRISFCQNVHARLNAHFGSSSEMYFYLYNSMSYRCEVLKALPQSRRNVVIQYESLWQVAHLKFDVVIIDEITTVLSCVTSPTNKDRLQKNAKTFKDFLNQAKHVLLMDADLNAKCLHLVKDFQDPSRDRVVFRQNNFRNAQLCKSVLLFTDRPKRYQWDQNIFACLFPSPPPSLPRVGKLRFLTSLKNRLLEKQRLVVITGSIKFFEMEIEPWLQANQIHYKWYKQNNGNEQDLIDINSSWSKKRKRDHQTMQVVAFTNRITVGLSYEQFDFDSIYIYGSPGSVIPRLLMQMRGRIRSLKESTISMYIFPRSDERVLTCYESIWNNMRARRHLLERFRCEEHEKLGETKWEWSQAWGSWQKEYEWVTKQYCFHELEINLSKSNFLLETLKQFIHNRYSWVCNDCFFWKDSLFPHSGSVAVSPSHAENFEFFASLPLVTRKELRILQQKRSNENKFQTIKSKLYYTFALQEFHIREENEKQICLKPLTLNQNKLLWSLFKIQNNKQLKKKFFYNWLLHFYPLPSQWATLLNKGSLFHIGQEFCPRQVVRYRLIYEIVTRLGFAHLNDYETVISSRMILGKEEQRSKMIGLLQESEVMFALNKSQDRELKLNLPGLIKKISNLLLGFSGHKIVPYCVTCPQKQQQRGTFGPCLHIKRKQVQYQQYKTRDDQGNKVKLYCFTYKMIASEVDPLITEIKKEFQSHLEQLEPHESYPSPSLTEEAISCSIFSTSSCKIEDGFSSSSSSPLEKSTSVV